MTASARSMSRDESLQPRRRMADEPVIRLAQRLDQASSR